MEVYQEIESWIRDILREKCSPLNDKWANKPIGSWLYFGSGVHDLQKDHVTTLNYKPYDQQNFNYVKMPHGVETEIFPTTWVGWATNWWADGAPEWKLYPDMVDLTMFQPDSKFWYSQALWESAGLRESGRTPSLVEMNVEYTMGYQNFPTSLNPWIPTSDILISAKDTFARPSFIHSKMASAGFLNKMLSTNEANSKNHFDLIIDPNNIVGAIIAKTKYYLPAKSEARTCKKLKIPLKKGPNSIAALQIYYYDKLKPNLYACDNSNYIIVEDYCEGQSKVGKVTKIYFENCMEGNNYCCPGQDPNQCIDHHCGASYDWYEGLVSLCAYPKNGNDKIQCTDIYINKTFNDMEEIFYNSAQPGYSISFMESPYLIGDNAQTDYSPPQVLIDGSDKTADWYNSYFFIPKTANALTMNLNIYPADDLEYEAMIAAFYQYADHPVYNYYLKEDIPYHRISYIDRNKPGQNQEFPDILSVYGIPLNDFSLSDCLTIEGNNLCKQDSYNDPNHPIKRDNNGNPIFPYVWDRFNNVIKNANQIAAWDDYNVALVDNYDNVIGNDPWGWKDRYNKWGIIYDNGNKYSHAPTVSSMQVHITIKEDWKDYNDDELMHHKIGNFLLETDFKFNNAQGFAGIIFHINFPTFYYIKFTWVSETNGVWQFGYFNGRKDNPIGKPISMNITAGTPYYLKFEAKDGKYKLYVQDWHSHIYGYKSDFIGEFYDVQLPLQGLIGLMAAQDASIQFGELKLAETDQVPNLFINGGLEPYGSHHIPCFGWEILSPANCTGATIHTGVKAVHIPSGGILMQAIDAEENILDEKSRYEIYLYAYPHFKNSEDVRLRFKVISLDDPDFQPYEDMIIFSANQNDIWNKVRFSFKTGRRGVYKIIFTTEAAHQSSYINIDDLKLIPLLRDARWDIFSANDPLTHMPLNWVIKQTDKWKVDCRYREKYGPLCCGSPNSNCSAENCQPYFPKPQYSMYYKCGAQYQDWLLWGTGSDGMSEPIIGGDSGWDNFIFEAKISKEKFSYSPSCSENSSAIIFFNYNDENTNYYAKLDYYTDRVKFMHLYKNNAEIEGCTIPIPDGQADKYINFNPQIRSLRVIMENADYQNISQCQGNPSCKKISIILDGITFDTKEEISNNPNGGKYMIVYYDPTPLPRGKFGLAYQGDCIAFDGIRIQPIKENYPVQ